MQLSTQQQHHIHIHTHTKGQHHKLFREDDRFNVTRAGAGTSSMDAFHMLARASHSRPAGAVRTMLDKLPANVES